MAVRVVYSIDSNSKKVLERMGDIAVKSWKSVLLQFGYQFRAGMSAIFANKAGRVNSNMVDGPVWRPLNAKYQAIKSKIVPLAGTLVWNGKLRKSFTDTGDGNNINLIKDTEAEFGSSNPLARYHQDGHSKGWYPARPIVFESPKRNEEFVLILINYFNAMFKAKGLNMRVR
ncbi:hypothetical protein Emin_0949 [Elusimicrobium minutum Pei191]|uniref:Uncharacterized protein n=1 Tax=Elusimicrobium minutum (strain Pei191) TaxID=445932 RepID=B2KDA6_ELUMP|nr:hypothetical protein [Elusimicrobium minutum]ACC98502.1 hypothetical protein Emin_0949 [Elusimicrobium minutum Pei191]